MSHATGAVLFTDSEVLFYEYNGTADVVIQPMYKTLVEVMENWRSEFDYRKCKCNLANHEPVRISTTYGRGYSWPGTACRSCMIIIGGLYPGESSEETGGYVDGWPDWAREAHAKQHKETT